MEGTERSSPHTLVFLESCPQSQHLQTSGFWGCLPASCLNGDQSSPWAQQTYRQCELCGSLWQESNLRWSVLGDSKWWPDKKREKKNRNPDRDKERYQDKKQVDKDCCPTCAVNPAASWGGSDLLSPQTLPLLMSFTDTFFTLKPTLSPGRASLRVSWCISTDFTSVVMLTGAKVTTILGRMIPVSTLPTGTVPIPEEQDMASLNKHVLYTKWCSKAFRTSWS